MNASIQSNPFWYVLHTFGAESGFVVHPMDSKSGSAAATWDTVGHPTINVVFGIRGYRFHMVVVCSCAMGFGIASQ